MTECQVGRRLLMPRFSKFNRNLLPSLLIGSCALCVLGWAAEKSQAVLPESYIALLRSDVQARKVDILRQDLSLSDADDQTKKFWVLQRSYEYDLSKLADERLDVVRDYVKNWDNLNDDSAKDLGKRLFEFEKKRVELRHKYFERFSKELSPTLAAKFFQLEIQMENMIDVAVESAVPLVK